MVSKKDTMRALMLGMDDDNLFINAVVSFNDISRYARGMIAYPEESLHK